MSAKVSRMKMDARRRIEAERKEVVKLCSEVIRIPSDNPPGDTRSLASFLRGYLEERGIRVEAYEPRTGNPNLVASVEGEGQGAHLVLNAHMDQFPSEVGERWTVDPYAGEVKGGRIYGRGAADMKGGLTALTFGFALVREMGVELPGRLTLTLVSDEETGGRWGTRWLLDNVPGLLGDACLNAEPSGLTVRIGEKGTGSFRLRAVGKPSHGSFAGYAGVNAIMKMVRALPRVESLSSVNGRFTAETGRIIEEAMRGYEAQYGHEGAPGMSRVLKHVTVNVGVIRGGSKVNIVPGVCEAEVDIRIPLGVTWEEIRRRLRSELDGVDPSIEFESGWEEAGLLPANFTLPGEKIVQALRRNAAEVTGETPLMSFTSGATDCRFFRARNVPSVVYGPKSYNQAAADEYITVDDLIKVTNVHAGTIIEYMNRY